MSQEKIILVGASGLIGSAIDQLLSPDYEIIRAGFSDADLIMDLSDPQSILAGLKKVGTVDHIISAAGRANFVPLHKVQPATLEESPYGLGILDKLMGQVNLALAARDYLNEKGSVTLTSGVVSNYPIIGGSSLSMVNGALEKWAKAAATEMPNGIRINVVSPSVAAECGPKELGAFPGFKPVPVMEMALAYKRCVASYINGETIEI